MNSNFPLAVGKIVNDYIDRLSARLKGMPDNDSRELLNEIRSHIYESYVHESGGDEIERILAVLRRLGEPSDVISSRMPEAVTRLGKGKKAPLYILAGVLIALLGVPLGLGALGLLVGLLAALLGLIIGFYGAGISLVVAGFVTAIICLIAIIAPGVLYNLNHLVGMEVFQFGPFQHNPEVGGFLALIVALIVVALGLLMLWSGRYFWRGFCFVIILIAQKVRGIFNRRIQSSSNRIAI